MKIEKGLRVTLEYELRVDGGEIVESSSKTGPLQYVHGEGKMLPALERQIEGLTAGEEREGLIMAAEAYGDEESLPTKEIKRDEFSEDEPPEVGKSYQARDPHGAPVDFSVVAIDGDSITIRFNHPLAGKDLRYKVKILNVAEPGQPPPPPID
jgi:FKBP-type peptidyl-prolyl cis-trans isomerase 2